jgi:hypothetical protein
MVKARGSAERARLDSLYNQWQAQYNDHMESAGMWSNIGQLFSLTGDPIIGAAIDSVSTIYHQATMPENFMEEMDINLSEFRYAGASSVEEANAASSDALDELSMQMWSDLMSHGMDLYQTQSMDTINDSLDRYKYMWNNPTSKEWPKKK